jgi:sugar lactone lactonase YvrE
MKLALASSSVLVAFGFLACGDAPSPEHAASFDNTAEAGIQCASLPSGPVTPQLVGALFRGSEDFTFDGRGHIIGKRGSDLVAATVDAAAPARTIAQLPGQTYGVRYLANGDLVAAIPGAGKVVRVTPAGQVSDLATGLGGPNGVYVDFDENVWITEFGGGKVVVIAPNGAKQVVVSGANAQAPNGVVVDAARKLLFYTEYSKGKIHRLSLETPGAQPVLVATVQGASLDGMVLDACGNVYAVDQGRSRLFRVRTDDSGAATAAPELLASFPTNVANAQFGSGEGFDPKKLYVAGNPGTVYALDLGVAGAPVPTPTF